MKIFGSKQVKRPFKYKTGEENGDGLATRLGNIQTVLQGKL